MSNNNMFLFRNKVAPTDEDENIDYETNVLVLGCGPAGLGLLVRAAREDKITSLLTRTPTIVKNEILLNEINNNKGKKKIKKNKKKIYKKKKNEYGLIIIDKASEDRIGGGKLQDYLIRSNTSSARFVGTVTGISVSTSQSPLPSPRKKQVQQQQQTNNNVSIKKINDAVAKKIITNNDDPLSESIGYTLDKPQKNNKYNNSSNNSNNSKKPNESTVNDNNDSKTNNNNNNNNKNKNKLITRRESSLGDTVGDGGSVNTGRCEALIDVATTDCGVELIGHGKYHIPLHLVGEFLSKATMPALKKIMTKSKTSGFFHSCEAESVSIEEDGTYTVIIKRINVKNEKKAQVNENNNKAENNNDNLSITRQKIKCHQLIFALGGSQRIPTWLPTSVRPQTMVIRSDHLLTQDGLDSVVFHLRSSLQFPSVRNREHAPLVCIVGGSHSAFSSAWLLLNGPAHGADNEESRLDVTTSKTPIIKAKWKKSAKLAQSMGQTLRSPSEFPLGTWGFRRNDVMILHRSRIKVHFASDQEARSVGYRYLPEEAQGSWRKSIYPFGGLRGDAKRLYLTKKNGTERRLQTKQVQNHKELLLTLKKSKPLVVVWAGGYEANSIPILDHLGNEVQIVKDSRGQYMTDNFSQLQFLKSKINDDKNNDRNKGNSKSNKTASTAADVNSVNKIEAETLNKCFAIGLGAGLPSGREEIGGELLDGTRADGFNVYVGPHGKIILDKMYDKIIGETLNVKEEGNNITDSSKNMNKNPESSKVNHLNPQEGVVSKKKSKNQINGLRVDIDNHDWMIDDDEDNNKRTKKDLDNNDVFDPLVTTMVKAKSNRRSCAIQ